MRPALAVILTSGLLLFSGLMVINWQLWVLARDSAITAARQSVERIESIIEEARQAGDTVAHLAQGKCTPDALYILGREAALRPHIRAVTLLKGRTIWCSSLTGSYPFTLPAKQITTERLTLYPGDIFSPGIPLLVLLIPAHDNYVAISINDVHLRDALLPVQGSKPLRFVVGNMVLGWQGEISVNPDASFNVLRISSSQFPFSVGYSLPPYFSFGRLFKQGLALSFMLVCFSLFAGFLLRRYLMKFTTPAENLIKAMERNEIIPYYQPVINGLTGKINGVEVLARWKHPVAGFIPPDAFIPVAEKSGLIVPLTRYLMNKVRMDLVKIAHLLPEDFHTGINVSAATLTSPHLNDDCMEFLNAFKKSQITLVLEITERMPLEITAKLQEQFSLLRESGIKFALDDFGAGYSGLSYLNDMVPDIIKIDKSFVSRITKDPESTRLIECVIDMARKMSFSIVAEGVEEQVQADYLMQQDIQMLQGYYYYRPLPFHALVKTIMNKGRI